MHTKTIRPTDPAPSMATNMKAMAGLAIMLAGLVPTEVLAQSRTFYDASGRVTGRSITGSNDSTTIYDASGRVTGRTSTGSNGTTTIYGSDGHRINTVTTTKPQDR